MTATVTQQQIEDFERDGVVRLTGLFGDWMEVLRAGVARNLAEPSADVRIYQGAGGRFVGDYCNWARIPEFRDFIFNSNAAEFARQLMRSRTVRLFHEHVLVKEPGADIPTPWHHDQPYYNVDGAQNVSLWIPLDTVPRETCPQYVAGSHRWGRWFRPERFNRTALYEDDGLEPVPDIDGNPNEYKILNWDLEPGDAIAFHYLTLHGAPGNSSAQRARRAFSLRLVGDDATFARRKGMTSPPFREVRLSHGAALEGPEFPLILPKAS